MIPALKITRLVFKMTSLCRGKTRERLTRQRHSPKEETAVKQSGGYLLESRLHIYDTKCGLLFERLKVTP